MAVLLLLRSGTLRWGFSKGSDCVRDGPDFVGKLQFANSHITSLILEKTTMVDVFTEEVLKYEKEDLEDLCT